MKKANENRFFMAQVHHGFDDNCSNGGRAEPTKEAFVGISFVAERPTELYLFISGGRAEPMKKANENRFFMAQVHHGFDDNCSNGGRAEI